MNTIIVNAFLTVCSFANPADCTTKLATTIAPAGYTERDCLAETREAGNKWLDAHAPTKLIARIRCEFVSGRGA